MDGGNLQDDSGCCQPETSETDISATASSPSGSVSTGAGFMPGPWSYDGDRIQARDADMAGSDPWLIAEIAGCCGYYRDTSDANAHLIAAAPDLYAALEVALAVHGSGYSWGEKALAALTKARGQ